MEGRKCNADCTSVFFLGEENREEKILKSDFFGKIVSEVWICEGWGLKNLNRESDFIFNIVGMVVNR